MVDLLRLAGKVDGSVIEQLDQMTLKYPGMCDPVILSHFLAQTAHESQGFTRTVENLNYSAVRLLQVFPKYFNGNNVEDYAGHPTAIASRVYADRMGNGTEDTGDGWRYRGRGYLQLTGHDNYEAFDTSVDENILMEPDLVATKYPMLSAGWFWGVRGLNGLASQGATHSVVGALTKAINGGTNGLPDRIKRFEYFYGLLE